MYSLSLGSKKGNAHLHWHVAHFPGRAYGHQRYYALMTGNRVEGLDDSFTTRETRLTRLPRVIAK